MKISAKLSSASSIFQLALSNNARSPLHPETASWKGRLASEGYYISKTRLKAADRLIKSLYKEDLRDAFLRFSLFDDSSITGCSVPLFFNQNGSPEPLEGSLNLIIGSSPENEPAEIFTLLPITSPFLLINTGKGFFLHCSDTGAVPGLYTATALDEDIPGRIRLSGISFGRKLTMHEEKTLRTALSRYFSSKGGRK